ncbi:class I SAM-dependent methyltransferase [Desulfofustis glycolicus]|uniref:Methyltransferase domain-containing protein n=1 Tax=Desulfofustis glycolicus DSM 9705 TaxID=1121409 RepID=A0A1M5X0K8_9BACT|nr:class I SAM-dependent methyltransferase [Desulfofustis glycolicus]MCB2218702.1 class I SAM-dependent methyltransferase [Desulfobulbaceae bacterium]SHH93399.1 Methyltransferase domain-containing protein [Desulfofustis glycolicus DSM 9705]
MVEQESIAGRNSQQAFWEEMAERYPRPFDRKTLTDSQRIMAITEDAGVIIDRAEILDIGCGTGTYTLPLALRAKRVTGIDSSAKMLAICMKEQAAAGLNNVRTLLMEWGDADVESLGFTRRFDVVWAAMTPALRTAEDLERMRRCARTSCVFVGWGSIRKNTFLEEIFTAHNRSFGPPPGAAAITGLLKAQGIRPREAEVRTHWDWQGTFAEACRNATGYLQVSGEDEISAETIQTIVSRYCHDDVVHHRTYVEMKVLVWDET